MIIECPKCNSKFELNDSLLEKGPRKLRCSRCKEVFMASPPAPESPAEKAPDQIPSEELDETMALESALAEQEAEAMKADPDLDEIFEKALQEIEPLKAAPWERPKAKPLEKDDMEIAIEEAARMEEKAFREDRVKGIGREIGRSIEASGAKPLEGKLGLPRFTPIVLGIIIVVLLVVVGIFFASDWLPFLKPQEKEELADLGIRRLLFDAVTGSFTRSEENGQLFVISGKVTNNYPKNRSFVLIRGAILDDDGQVVKRKLVYAGNVFTQAEIARLSMEEIDKGLKNRFGKNRTNFNIEPGGTVPFMIVFGDLPENISEFTVEAVSSTPGK